MPQFPCPVCKSNGWKWKDGSRETCRACGGAGMVDYDELQERRRRKRAKLKRRRAKPR